MPAKSFRGCIPGCGGTRAFSDASTCGTERSQCHAQAAKGGRRKRGVLESLQENAVEATPMPGDKSRVVPFTPAAAATVMRAPRLGETFYSQTGARTQHAPGCVTPSAANRCTRAAVSSRLAHASCRGCACVSFAGVAKVARRATFAHKSA